MTDTTLAFGSFFQAEVLASFPISNGCQCFPGKKNKQTNQNSNIPCRSYKMKLSLDAQMSL